MFLAGMEIFERQWGWKILSNEVETIRYFTYPDDEFNQSGESGTAMPVEQNLGCLSLGNVVSYYIERGFL